MKVAKKRLRTNMNDERLNSLPNFTLEILVLDQLSNSEVAEKHTKDKNRRRI